MPVFHFSIEEAFSGELINWDAIRKAQSYREPKWRSWMRKARSWLTKALRFSKPGDKIQRS